MLGLPIFLVKFDCSLAKCWLANIFEKYEKKYMWAIEHIRFIDTSLNHKGVFTMSGSYPPISRYQVTKHERTTKKFESDTIPYDAILCTNVVSEWHAIMVP